MFSFEHIDAVKTKKPYIMDLIFSSKLHGLSSLSILNMFLFLMKPNVLKTDLKMFSNQMSTSIKSLGSFP
jgi:hypothetical protein